MDFRKSFMAFLIFSCASSPSVNPGDEAFKKKDYSTAIAAYTESLKTKPNDFDLLFGRGRAKQELGNLEEALKTTDKILELNPTDESALQTKKVILMQIQEEESGDTLDVKPE